MDNAGDENVFIVFRCIKEAVVRSGISDNVGQECNVKMRRRVHKRTLSRDEAVIECDCAGRRLKGLGKKKNSVSDSETADVASHNRHADRCIPRRAHYVDNNASSARVVTAGRLAGLSVESIGRFLRFIRLFAISKEAPVFSFHSLNAAPGRRKKSAIIQPTTESALVTNGECTVSLAAMRSHPTGLDVRTIVSSS